MEDTLVTQHLTDERWREVFLLVAGLTGKKVDQLLIAIDEEARTYIAPHPKVRDLIEWADTGIDTSSKKYKAIAKRAAAMAIASTIDINIAKAISAKARARIAP